MGLVEPLPSSPPFKFRSLLELLLLFMSGRISRPGEWLPPVLIMLFLRILFKEFVRRSGMMSSWFCCCCCCCCRCKLWWWCTRLAFMSPPLWLAKSIFLSSAIIGIRIDLHLVYGPTVNCVLLYWLNECTPRVADNNTNNIIIINRGGNLIPWGNAAAAAAAVPMHVWTCYLSQPMTNCSQLYHRRSPIDLSFVFLLLLCNKCNWGGGGGNKNTKNHIILSLFPNNNKSIVFDPSSSLPATFITSTTIHCSRVLSFA